MPEPLASSTNLISFTIGSNALEFIFVVIFLSRENNEQVFIDTLPLMILI